MIALQDLRFNFVEVNIPKRKCSFNVSLQEKYPFIKQINTPSDVRCEKCRTEFSVSHSGGGDIEHNLKSDKHKNGDRAAASSSSMLNFFKKSDTSTLKDLDIAAAEGAIEAAKEIHQLKDNLTQKQTNQFLSFMVRQLMSKLKDSGIDIDEEYVTRTATEFYKTSREYLEQWTCFLTNEMETFYWADLKKVLIWEDVQKSLDVLIEKQYIDCEYKKTCQEFHSYLKSSPDILKQICSSDKYKHK
ncbi:hypothetical protein ACJJTC_019542 [Scirpophaga incertulas]